MLTPAVATGNVSVGARYTFQFTNQKATLTSASFRYFARVADDLKRAKSVRITAYASKTGLSSRQRALANSRVNTLVNSLKQHKISVDVTRSTSLVNVSDRVRQGQGVIQVLSLRPTVLPTPRPSATTSATPTPSPTASPSQTSLTTFNGKFALDFVDCNNADQQNPRRQVIAKSLTLTSISNSSLVYNYGLVSVATDRDGLNNNMNCTTTWSLSNVPVGTYNLAVDFVCDDVQSAGQDTPAEIACTPGNYLALVGSTATNGLGVGPSKTLAGYAMSLRYPTQIEISGNSIINLNMWSNY